MLNQSQSIRLPRHIAIIPDGNNRWAIQNGKTKFEGHRAGVKAIQGTIQAAINSGIEVLSIWILSTENLKRPKDEVDYLMHLSRIGLRGAERAIAQSHVQIRFIGDSTGLTPKLFEQMQELEQKTQKNTGLKLVIAAGYGGKWDIIQAIKKIADQVAKGNLKVQDINESLFAQYLSISDLPDPDLLIRTSGEQRMSNFYLWQLAYTELYFTSLFWPDFDAKEFQKALDFFATRERRFGVRNNR
ncbi:MAG: di-trans,poly-cis-decaprenylcistransferase [Gammaproteobacteria bacterium]|nr:di-trans,poly-cis-decaprenylcistransferase [Gammaproteobacteria bacterium]